MHATVSVLLDQSSREHTSVLGKNILLDMRQPGTEKDREQVTMVTMPW